MLNAETPASPDLLTKVADWLNREGYPTEFRTAEVFRKNGFHTRQGEHVRGDTDGTMREVDLIASTTMDLPDNRFLRVSHIVECKWSGDKPWVVFASPTNRMSPSACVAQTMASRLGAAMMYAMAGSAELHRFQLFSTPAQGGFGGRQAFSSGKDHFYSAVTGVVSNCASYIARYDRQHKTFGCMPKFGIMAFPVIVVDGDLYQAGYDEYEDKIKLESVDHVRCHWRGSPTVHYFSTVDVVSMRGLSAFVARLAIDTNSLLNALKKPCSEIAECCLKTSLDPLTITSGSRGFTGLPELLQEIATANKKKERIRITKLKLK